MNELMHELRHLLESTSHEVRLALSPGIERKLHAEIESKTRAKLHHQLNPNPTEKRLFIFSLELFKSYLEYYDNQPIKRIDVIHVITPDEIDPRWKLIGSDQFLKKSSTVLENSILSYLESIEEKNRRLLYTPPNEQLELKQLILHLEGTLSFMESALDKLYEVRQATIWKTVILNKKEITVLDGLYGVEEEGLLFMDAWE